MSYAIARYWQHHIFHAEECNTAEEAARFLKHMADAGECSEIGVTMVSDAGDVSEFDYPAWRAAEQEREDAEYAEMNRNAPKVTHVVEFVRQDGRDRRGGAFAWVREGEDPEDKLAKYHPLVEAGLARVREVGG